MNVGNRRINLGLVGLFVLVGLGLALLMTLSPAGAVVTGDVYSGTGDWVINQPTKAIDEVVMVNGSLEIKNVLELWNCTIEMNLPGDDAYKLNVTTSGNLMANNTLFTSTRTYYEYGYTVYGKMNLRRCVVEECYNGLQVLTIDTVSIQDTLIHKTYGMGLYLEDADGTTVNNITIQTNEISVYGTYSATVSGSGDYQQYHSVSASGGALYVKGGNPSIDGVKVSANGTMYLTATLSKYYYYFYMYMSVYFPLVGIDSDEMETVSGIHVRDSEIDITVTYELYDYYSYSYAYYYLYTYGYATAINVLNYGEVELKDCSAENCKVDRVYARGNYRYGSASYRYIYTYNYNYGMTLFGATINKMFSTAGPHVFQLTIKDATFENVGVLSASISPDYNGTLEPTFRSYIIIDNVKVNGGNKQFSFAVSPQFSLMKTFYNNVRISNSTFTNLTGAVLSTSEGAGPGVNANRRTFDLHQTILVENNLFRWCRQSSNGLFRQDSQYKQEYNNLYDKHLWIRNNRFMDNNGYLMYMYGNYYTTRGFERITLEDNTFHNNTYSSSGYMMYMTYHNRIKIHNNLFTDNVFYYGLYCIDYGGDYNGKKPDLFEITNNTFRRSYITYSGGTIGFFYIYWGGMLRVNGNNASGIENNWLSTYEYTYYTGYADLEFNENHFFKNNGTLLFHYGYYDYHEQLTCYIEDNLMEDNNAFLTDYYDYYVEDYDYDATIYIRNNSVYRSSGQVIKEYGNVLVANNYFEDCLGYVIELDHLNVHPPVVYGNEIKNCTNVYFIGAKAKGILKMSITMKDLKVDCTGNAFYFKRLDVTLQNVTVTNNATVAIIVEDANVDAMSSSIPIGSGQVIGEGTIYVWFEVEILVEWSNLADPLNSSGVRVSEALVVLYGKGNVYYTSEYTDANGHLQKTRIPQWSMKGSFTSIWTPYQVNVAKAGVTSNMSLPLFKDWIDEDALEFLLVDKYIPVVRITTPFPGDTFNSANLSMYGFSTEVGSGIGKVEVSFADDDNWTSLEWDMNGDFMHTFFDVEEGEDLALRARVTDVALNVNETVVTVSIDRTPPRLVVHHPEHNTITNQQDIIILGEYEPGATITINGLRREGTSGTLSEAYTLSEGRNNIVVEATDSAGNTARVTRSIRLDRFAPTLTVLAPRDGLVTHRTNTTVEGDVEEGSTVTVSVYRTMVNLINETITPDPDGAFSHGVDLEEGQNIILVRSVDTADNVAQVTRVVYLDTTAPLCTIISPENGHVTNVNTITVVGTAEIEGVTLYLNGKQIFNDGTIERVVNLNEGENIIELRAVDSIGNEYRHRVTVTLDTQPPVFEMERPVAEYIMTNSADVQVKGKVLGDATRLTVMGMDVAIGAQGGFDRTITMPEEGLNEVLLVARDEAGNLATHTITVDYSTAEPDLTVTFNPAHSVVESDDANLFIYVQTTAGIEEVLITHTSVEGTDTTSYTVSPEGYASVVKTLLDGDNTLTVAVTDDYGNVAESQPFSVNYKYKAPREREVDEAGIDPSNISIILLVISVALIATAIVVSRSFRRE